MKQYDVIVIGTGIGGLLCAGMLSKYGMKVLCLEKNPSPGGYVTSFKRKGFVFDSAVDCISGTTEDGLITRVIKNLGLDKEIDFTEVTPIRYSIFPDHSIMVYNNREAYIEELNRIFPEESKGIKDIFKAFGSIYQNATDAIESQICGKRIKKTIPDILIKAHGLSYQKLLDEYIADKRLKSVLSDRCPFIGLSPRKVSALSMVNLIMSYFVHGSSRVKGGYQTLSDKLVEAIKKTGSEVLTKKAVKKILTLNNKVMGVVCEDGQQYSAKYIVSNIDYFSTAKMLGDNSSLGLAKQYLINPGPSISFFIVYLGVKEMEISHSSIGYFPSYDVNGFFKKENFFRDTQTLGITVATVEEPERAPNRCHTVVAHEMVQWDDYRKNRGECIERVIERLEKVFPSIRSNIQIIESATPETLYRYTGNYQGAAFGWRQIPDRKFRFEFDVNNLFIAGHWGECGGGVLAASYSGVVTASKILSKEGERIEI